MSKTRNMYTFRAFFRFLDRHKLYTAVNVAGFGIALMFELILSVYTFQELSVDRFHKDGERIYLQFNRSVDGGYADANALKPAYWLKDRYPDIEEVCPVLLVSEGKGFFHHGKQENARVLLAEPCFFDFFSFPLKVGDPEKVLDGTRSVVVSESYARRMFGSEDPLGQELSMADSGYVVVSGIMEDFSNTQLPDCDMVIPMTLSESFGYSKENLFDVSSLLFVKMRPGCDMNAHRDDVLAMYRDRYWIFDTLMMRSLNSGFDDVRFVPIRQAYFFSSDGIDWDFSASSSETGKTRKQGDRDLVLILLGAASLILLFSVFNYINLTVAESLAWAKEVSMRRLLGSTRRDIVRILMERTFFLTLISLFLALLLAFAMLPMAEDWLQTPIRLAVLFRPAGLVLLMAGLSLISFLAGLLPSMLISSYRPSEAVKGSFHRFRLSFSKFFVVLQNTVTCLFLAFALVVSVQIHYMAKAPLGYRTDNRLSVLMADTEKQELLVEEWGKIPGVVSIGYTDGLPFEGGSSAYFSVKGQRKAWICDLYMDTAAFRMLGFELLSGYVPQAEMDGVLLTDNTFDVAGMDRDATDFEFYDLSSAGRRRVPIAGLVGEVRRGNILGEESAFCFHFAPLDKHWSYALLEVQGDPAEVYHQIESVYEQVVSGRMEACFLDAQVQDSFSSYMRMRDFVLLFALVSLLISLLGLLAMSVFFVQGRRQELAVRKVFGAESWQAMGLLLHDFLKYVAAGLLLAVPWAWYWSASWLSGFSYRIGYVPLWIALSVLFCLLVSFLSLGILSYRSAKANPVEGLRSE